MLFILVDPLEAWAFQTLMIIITRCFSTCVSSLMQWRSEASFFTMVIISFLLKKPKPLEAWCLFVNRNNQKTVIVIVKMFLFFWAD